MYRIRYGNKTQTCAGRLKTAKSWAARLAIIHGRAVLYDGRKRLATYRTKTKYPTRLPKVAKKSARIA